MATSIATTRLRGGVVREGVIVVAFLGLFVAGMLASSLAPSPAQLAAIGLLGTVTFALPAVYQARRGADMSMFLLVPTLMSAFQNVYLLPVAQSLAPARLQVLIVLNFINAVILLGVFLTCAKQAPCTPQTVARDKAQDRLIRMVALTALAVTAYGLLSAVLLAAEPIAALASYRNLVTPMLFVLLGLLAAHSTTVRHYSLALIALGGAVIMFGIYELVTPRFWQDAGIEALWSAKGIRVSPGTGLPGNFYSSEQVDDQQIRRMVGSFADPVNLGTFLFALLVATWLMRRWILLALTLAAILLAVSKGALLGVLIFAALWSHSYANRLVRTITILAVLAAGTTFYMFAITSSTGSTTAHINGFVAALLELPQHPLGRGMGNVGVLAGLFDGGSDSAVSETGIGSIVSQLGLVGIIAYGTLFTQLLRHTRQIDSPRLRLAAQTLILGFLANAAFNEVALSPNSAAPIFILTGLILGPQKTTQHPLV